MESLILNQLRQLPLPQKLELIEYLLNHKEALSDLSINNDENFKIAIESINRP
jgi:hypothetical protein